MPRYRFRHALVAVLVFVAMLGQETWALAGTTGRLNGTVVQADSGAPIANAKVTVTSPSQTATTSTNASGAFQFISLSPDTYTVSVEKENFQPVSEAGTAIFADATAAVQLRMTPVLSTIAKVTSTAAGSLVKRGTTADVYSINAATQDKFSGLGGGGGLNSAYSAIASVPGAFVPMNQVGYFQTVHIRGGDYDQVGYELDGVPVNRSFDNYPSGAASSLGQQEVQVYTGASPANSEGQGLAGYINQVIKTGTYPGFAQAALGIGAPTFYHKAAIETGGATPNRMFSYYVGIGGFDQGIRYIDQDNGASFGEFAGALAPTAAGTGTCPANLAPTGCYALAPYQYSFQSGLTDRDVVMNVHFGLPHKNDGGHDDVQLLWDSGYLNNTFYTSTGDAGGYAAFGGIAHAPVFIDGYQWTCGGTGTTTLTLNAGCVTDYAFPNTPQHPFFGTIPLNLRDSLTNDQEIVKLQYQKNFGSDAFFRIYGYTYYSEWTHNAPNGTFANYLACCAPNYILDSHTRGLSATLSKQFNEQNLVTLQANYTTATSIRDNNTQMLNSVSAERANGVVMVNANAPLSGYCFTPGGTATTCSPIIGSANFATWGGIQSGTVPALAGSCNIPGGAAGPCTWLVAENSLFATYNNVQPKFGAISLTDEFRPNDRLLLNLGLREDQYQFVGANTNTGPARTFWFTAWNLDNCIAPTGLPVDKSTLGLTPNQACPAGYTAGNLQNVSGQVNTYNIFQPRLGGTYTLNPDTVVRFSAGKYAEPPNTAFEQYDTLQEDSPFTLLGSAFYKFGFTTPGHVIVPPTSWNYDLSLEKRLHGTDISFKLTPFFRDTKDQIQNFYLDQKTGFISGLNVGRQTSEGLEFQLNDGDFTRNGFAGQISFAYTHSQIRYDALSNGSTVVSGINADIAAYNALTKGGGGSPCYTAGVASACTVAGAVANPYFNAPLARMIDPSQAFPTYDLFPGPIQSSAVAFGAPYVATVILSYKHDKLAITPSVQFAGGARYGAPETTLGVNPLDCNAGLTGSATGDPRYPYGAVGGAPYDATNCAGIGAARGAPVTIPIPDPYTGVFDDLGSFTQPNQLVANLQISYDVSPKVTLVGTFANIANTCWGGSKEPWTVVSSNICGYSTLNNGGAFGPVGNLYNPPATVASFQRLIQFPYGAYAGTVNPNTATGEQNIATKMPFNFYFEARIKL